MAYYLHDNTPAASGEKHGARGPTHCGTYHGSFDYEYQVEMWLEETAADYPMVVRIETGDGGRGWIRQGQRFVPREPVPIVLDVTRRCAACLRHFLPWHVGPLGDGGQPAPDLDRCAECQPKGSLHRVEPNPPEIPDGSGKAVDDGGVGGGPTSSPSPQSR